MNKDEDDQKSTEELDEPAADAGPFTPARALILGMYDKAERMSETKERASGLATGYDDLDAITGGLQQGNLVIVAGGAGMAKSTLCQNIARLVSKRRDIVVAFFNLESTNQQVVRRLLSADAGVDPLGFLSARLNEDEWGEVANCVQGLYDARLLMDDRPHKSVTDIWAACDELLKASALGLVIIDSLPLISGLAPANIWDAAKLLKLMARHLNVPVVVATHLYSGRTDRRSDRHPMMDDLAGVENYADEVLLLHRPMMTRAADSYKEMEALDVIVAKQANGPVGLIRLGFLPQHALITDFKESMRTDEPTGF